MNASSPAPDFAQILTALARGGVRFVVVGGVGAVLQGAPINTFDLDIVHQRDDDNITHLIAALREMGAVYRIRPERKLEPDATHLRSPGHRLPMTMYGPLDLPGTIGHSRTYEDLVGGSIAFEVSPGVVAHVADLADIIASKEEAAGEKDLAVLPILRRTLSERTDKERMGGAPR